MGKTPQDLWREDWDPDKDNLEREECTVIEIEQRLLICEASRAKSASPTFPRTKSSSSTLRTLVSRRISHHRPQETSGASLLHDEGIHYEVVGKKHPKPKSQKTFMDMPDALKPVKPKRGDETGFEAIRAAHNYLRNKTKREEWKIVGVIPKTGINGQLRPMFSKTKDSDPPATDAQSAWPPSTSDARPQPRQFVLIERYHRCNCEVSYRPQHKLKVNYKPGYTPPTEAERTAAHKKYERDQSTEQSAAAASSAAAAAAAAGASAACSGAGAAACGGGGGGGCGG